MTTNPMYPHPHHAHWPESAAALLALGFAEAFTRCQPPPSNQLTMQKDLLSTRPLPSVVGFTVLLPAIGSLPHANPFDFAPWSNRILTRSLGTFPGSNVTEQSDFPGKNHSSAFAAQRTVSCACRARFGIHLSIHQK